MKNKLNFQKCLISLIEKVFEQNCNIKWNNYYNRTETLIQINFKANYAENSPGKGCVDLLCDSALNFTIN